MDAMDTCPKCESNRVHRSKTRNAWEKFRRDFSQKRLYRCHSCGWRGWGEVSDREPSADASQMADAPPPDFDAIDAALSSDDKTATRS
jgi:predicted RNA-binding Zn-ribbon protein involved in translation (DUF1610 family)